MSAMSNCRGRKQLHSIPNIKNSNRYPSESPSTFNQVDQYNLAYKHTNKIFLNLGHVMSKKNYYERYLNFRLSKPSHSNLTTSGI